MLRNEYYLFIIISLATGLLGLLGSVGIFISLVIQRKVERLQDILEELIDLTYSEEQNLTGPMFRTVQKYQMHYLIPEQPVKTIMFYVDATISLVLLIWSLLHLAVFRGSDLLQVLPFLLPVSGAVVILFFFRKLLRYAINPLDNPLLNGIIPPPAKLRSISFLSGYINVSVKAVLKQVRFNLFINHQDSCDLATIILKEELSFDDFFYFLNIGEEEAPLFAGFGRISFSFSPDPITEKPSALRHNINVPLGKCPWTIFQEKELEAQLLLFPYGEKHPIQCAFTLHRQGNCFIALDKPETTIINSILYKARPESLTLLENESEFSPLANAINSFSKERPRNYSVQGNPFQVCPEDCYID